METYHICRGSRVKIRPQEILDEFAKVDVL